MLFASTITFFVFKIGSVSGFIIGPQDLEAINFEETTFYERVKNLDPDGDGEPNEDLVELYTDVVNIIPVNSKEHYDNIVEYGGLLLTGQLYMPDVIADPVAVITTMPEWAETTIFVDGIEFLAIQAVESGTNYNDVNVIFLDGTDDGVTAGNETVVYDESNIWFKRLIITVEDGVSTAQQIADAIDAEGTFRFKGVNPDDILDPDAVIDLTNMTVDITAGGVNGIDWTLPTLNWDDLSDILTNFNKVKKYIEQIIEGLKRQSEWAKLQIYIASPAKLLEVATDRLDTGSSQASTTVTSKSPGTFEMVITAREYGAEYNDVSIIFQDGATAGQETVVYDHEAGTLTITIQDGISLSSEVKRAINKEGTFFATCENDLFGMTLSDLEGYQLPPG